MPGVQNHRRVGTIINLHIEENQVTLHHLMENPRIGRILCPTIAKKMPNMMQMEIRLVQSSLTY